ncbi:MAG: hypothetical protein M3R36_00350 [Bacteroidota bacterium]|nr:hypothetical protein [Bacteroidota bacterium]
MLNIKNNTTTFSIFIFPLLISLIVFANACNKNAGDEKQSETIKKDTTVKQIVYTCPMHPEVKSMNKDDKCPKCGMNLEEMKAGSMNDSPMKMHSDKYSLNLTTEPQSPKAGEEVTLNFSLMNNETKQQIRDLEVVHEKILHLIIVSKNLAYFDHIHPEMNSDGSLSVKTKFDKGGDYVLYGDLTPKGEKKNQVFDIPLKVAGEPVANIPLTARNTFDTEGYSAVMTTDPSNLVANKSTEIVVKLTKNGKDVTDLKNYLAALGHMVVISEDASMYLHVHPMEAEEKNAGHKHEEKKEMKDMKMDSDKISKSGPNVVFHTNFPMPGIYKVFAQFNPGGKLITTNFVVNVK